MYKYLKAVLIIVLVVILVFSGLKLYDIGMEYFRAVKAYDEIAEQYISVKETVPKVSENLESDEEDEDGPMEDDPGEYAPIEVNFDDLLKLNSDVVGWLYCEDTVINYPLVQGPDNNYYLNRMLSKVGNGSGTLFIDYRNARDFSHYNTIIYGHNMKNKTMFGTLPNYRKQEYYDEHPVMYLLTPTQDYKILLFAGYVTPSNSDTYFIAENTEERDLLIEKALSNTTFLSDVEILDTDRIITMSTCVYDFTNARYVVLGVMREVGKYQPPEMIEDVGD